MPFCFLLLTGYQGLRPDRPSNGVNTEKAVGELERGPTRGTRVGERVRGPTWRETWESQKRPHLEGNMGEQEGGPMQGKIQKCLTIHYPGQKFMCL